MSSCRVIDFSATMIMTITCHGVIEFLEKKLNLIIIRKNPNNISNEHVTYFPLDFMIILYG